MISTENMTKKTKLKAEYKNIYFRNKQRDPKILIRTKITVILYESKSWAISSQREARHEAPRV